MKDGTKNGPIEIIVLKEDGDIDIESRIKEYISQISSMFISGEYQLFQSVIKQILDLLSKEEVFENSKLQKCLVDISKMEKADYSVEIEQLIDALVQFI